jgi:hypothetical protein
MNSNFNGKSLKLDLFPVKRLHGNNFPEKLHQGVKLKKSNKTVATQDDPDTGI